MWNVKNDSNIKQNFPSLSVIFFLLSDNTFPFELWRLNFGNRSLNFLALTFLLFYILLFYFSQSPLTFPSVVIIIQNCELWIMNYICFLTELTDETEFFFANVTHRDLTVLNNTESPPRPLPSEREGLLGIICLWRYELHNK